MNRDVAIGRHLSVLRERANVRQHEMARQLGWSPAVLSRVENGDRPLTNEERSMLISAIGTSEARAFGERLAREWRIIPEPSFDEPDVDLIWEAEQAAQRIQALASEPDVKSFFERRLSRYMDELRGSALRLMDHEYRVVFAGPIAAGKSTAICRAERLEISGTKAMPTPVLETGPGGITLCTVHIRRGPGYGTLIEPCSEEELRRHVQDFARSLFDTSESQEDPEANDSSGLSREIDRVLRNMADLRRLRPGRRPDGTRPPSTDKARELAEHIGDIKGFGIEVLARLQLHRRDRRDLWHDAAGGKLPLEWLQEVFEQVNNGLHPEISLPRRMEIIVPDAPLGEMDHSIILIDTQGIDDVAGRADLEQHFDDPHTVVVLCTKFEEAPSVHIRQLLTRASEAGVRTLRSHVAVLVLPRRGEALQMKDLGVAVRTAEDGYDVKEDQVRLKLQQLGLGSLPILFFDAAEQEPEVLRGFLRARVAAVRESHRELLHEVISDANALLMNYEKEQAHEATRQAAQPLRAWLKNNATLKLPTRHVHDSLVDASSTAHSSTIHAAVVREGNWPKLSYGHHLSHGARRMAAQVAEPKLVGFREIATNVLQQEQLTDGHDLVRQALRALEEGFDTLIRKVQLVGQSVHSDELSVDNDFWQACSREWGRGSSTRNRYKDRIIDRDKSWFEDGAGKEADERVHALIQDEWAKAVEAVNNLMPHD